MEFFVRLRLKCAFFKFIIFLLSILLKKKIKFKIKVTWIIHRFSFFQLNPPAPNFLLFYRVNTLNSHVNIDLFFVFMAKRNIHVTVIIQPQLSIILIFPIPPYCMLMITMIFSYKFKERKYTLLLIINTFQQLLKSNLFQVNMKINCNMLHLAILKSLFFFHYPFEII